MRIRKSTYDIGDWVIIKPTPQNQGIGVIIDVHISSCYEAELYRMLLQTHHEPIWFHVANIKEALG